MSESRVHYVHHGEIRLDIGPHVFPIEKYLILSRWLSRESGIDAERIHAAEAIDLDITLLSRMKNDFLEAESLFKKEEKIDVYDKFFEEIEKLNLFKNN